ncbi:hypothetical protein PANT_5c00027, partial [Moesziomyces antarcticus T-34]
MQNSPASSHNPFPSSSTPNSFMDTFDFGNPDFSTASSGIDDLNIFPANSAHSVSSHHNAHSDAGSAPVSHHPSPSAAFNHSAAAHSSDHQPGSATHGAAAFLNAPSHAGSPLAFPRNRFDNHASTSPQGSTANQAGSDSGHNRPPSTVGSEINFAGSRHLDSNHAAGSAMQPSHSNQSHMNDHDNNMPQLSIADLQQMLLERERTERIQNMQTALLKQQLDQLARTQQQQHSQQRSQQQPAQQQQHQQHQQQQHMHNAGPSSNLQLNLSGGAGQLSPGQQQSLLAALQSAFAAGNNPSAHNNVLQAAHYQQQQQQQQQSQGQNAWQQNQSGAGGDQASVLAQYGLITPMGSGPFNSTSCPPGSANFMSPLTMQPNSQPGSVGVEQRPGHDYVGSYTPLESPAMTPASVFSTGSTGIVMSELFSPLTSPALGPHPPSLGEIMLPPAQLQHPHQQGMHASPAVGPIASSFTPTASPLALIAKGSSKIRKNRSTTAEARANKVRPSPLIKPVPGPSIKKKKDATGAATPAANGNANGHANGGAS